MTPSYIIRTVACYARGCVAMLYIALQDLKSDREYSLLARE
jgi:hypothetical protein